MRRETYEYAHESEVKRREEIKDELVEELAEAIREVREKRETASYSEFSPSPTYTNYTNTNIGTTTERDSSWGVATIISVIIVGISIIVGIIYYKEHNSGPLRHPEPTSFSVIINSSPSGATVFIDRKQVGLTPYSTTLEPGSYGISVEKEGYESAYGITEGENREFNFKLKED
ncbi:MAG: PEGA domain-containing protein [Candidatus Brocadiaceae bacterium]